MTLPAGPAGGRCCYLAPCGTPWGVCFWAIPPGGPLWHPALTWPGRVFRFRANSRTSRAGSRAAKVLRVMKVRNSLKSLRGRHRDNRLVRRKGRVYVINKTQKRFKARQG